MVLSGVHRNAGLPQERWKSVVTLAEVQGRHAPRFRDTSAVELLVAGVPLEPVSVLLGQQSVRITERHYSPWVRPRQDQLEQDLQRVWSRDLIALMETNGTPEVGGRSGRINECTFRGLDW